MELAQYILLLRRWWWLLMAVAVFVGGVAYIYGQSQDPIYQAQVKLFTGSFIQDPNPISTEIQTGNDLALTYANLVTVRPILEATITELDLDVSPEVLRDKIRTNITPETSLLNITVQDNSRVLVAEIANELANQLILNSPTNLNPEQEQRRTLLEDQLDTLFIQTEDARQELAELDQQLSESPTEQERQDLETQRATLLDRIFSWETSITNLSEILNSIDTQTNRLTIVEPAIIPDEAVGPPVLRNTLLAVLVSLMLTAGGIILLEYLDNTFHDVAEVRDVLNLPVLSSVHRYGKRQDGYREKLVMLSAPNSAPSESYRALRTNLLYGMESKEHTRLVVTSTKPADGKTLTATNLAVSLAKAEYKTILIDADLYRPKVHLAFGLSNTFGLANLFKFPLKETDELSLEELQQFLQPTEIDNLMIITSGSVPSSPAELLGLPHISVLCRSLEAHFGVTMIIFDSPPMMSVVDSIALSSKIDASILLVLQANKTRRAEALQAVEQCRHVDANIAGVVLNNVRKTGDSQYYYYRYGYKRETP